MSRCVPPLPGTKPRLTSAVLKIAVSSAMRISVASIKVDAAAEA